MHAIPATMSAVSGEEGEALRHRRLIVFTGCGDSLAVAEFGARMLLQEGLNAIALSPPELLRVPIDGQCVVIGVTASGRSLSTLAAIEYAAECGATTIALTDNKEGRIVDRVEVVWLTRSGVESYNIIPTAPTTAAMAYLLAVVSKMSEERYQADVHVLSKNMSRVFEWAEREGRKISELITTNQTVYLISEGPHYVAAQLGMMKICESSMTLGVSVLREEFQHYGSLPTRAGDAAILITDSPPAKHDLRFLEILERILELRSYLLCLPDELEIRSPFAQVIPNVIALQTAVHNALTRTFPDKEWFRLPHAKAFEIY